jgi:CO/xanthine dehydrogenase Mo-binding subunit
MGRARYAADIHPVGLLYGKILRSPHPHARINQIDATRSLALPGGKAVTTATDFPAVCAAMAGQEAGKHDAGRGLTTQGKRDGIGA